MNKSARNERRKITATYFNTFASAVVVIGGLAPLATLVYGNNPAVVQPGNLAIGAMVCILISGALHWIARRVLRGIEE